MCIFFKYIIFLNKLIFFVWNLFNNFYKKNNHILSNCVFCRHPYATVSAAPQEANAQVNKQSKLPLLYFIVLYACAFDQFVVRKLFKLQLVDLILQECFKFIVEGLC